MKEIKNAYLREAGACFPDDVFIPPAEDKSKVIMLEDLLSTRILKYWTWNSFSGVKNSSCAAEKYTCNFI